MTITTTNVIVITHNKLVQAVLVLPFTCGQEGTSLVTETDYPDRFPCFFI